MQRILRPTFPRWAIVLLLLAWLPVRAAEADAEGIITLPRFEVRDSRVTYLVSIPGYEILSLVGPKETAEFANQLQRQTWFIPLLVPPGHRATPPVPATIILQSRSVAQIKSARIDGVPEQAQPWIMSPSGTGWTSGYPPNTIRVWQPDEDTFTVFSEYRAKDTARNSDAVTLRAEVQATLIWLSERKILRLPRWYRDELIESLFFLNQITPAQATWEYSAPSGFARTAPMPLAKVFPISEKDDVARYVDTKRPIMAFVYWGFWADHGRRRPAFLKFIDATARAPVTETMFRDIFGLDFAAAEKAMKSITARDLEQPRRLPRATALPPRQVVPADVRPATAAEVARIMGAAYVAEGAPAPQQSPKTDLLERARALLSAAYESGDRDPRLLAVFGFLELASGQRDRAKDYFEMAAAAKIVRPRVYLELARIRLGEALSATAVFDETTSTHIMEPLFVAQAQSPELQSTYELMVEIEARRSTPPPLAELKILRENIWGLREPPPLGFQGTPMRARLLGNNNLIDRWTIDRANLPPPRDETRLQTLLQRLKDNGGNWDEIKFSDLKPARARSSAPSAPSIPPR